MSLKPRRKPNQKASHAKRAKRLMGNVRLTSWESSFVLSGEGIRTSYATAKVMGVERVLDQGQVNLIVKQRLNWVVVCRALCELNGDMWIESEAVSIKDFKINDLADHYEKMREQVMASVNKRQVVDVGWICHTFRQKSPIDDNLELKDVEPITEERRNAWQYMEEKVTEDK